MREDQFLRQRLQKEIPIEISPVLRDLITVEILLLNSPQTLENLCVNPLFRTGDNLTGNFKEEYNTY